MLNLRRIYKIPLGDLEISVVFKHSRVYDLGNSSPVKAVKVLLIKRHGNFYRSVSAEIKQNYRIVVAYPAYWLAVLGYYKRGQILIDYIRILAAVCLDSLTGGTKLPSQTVNMSIPAELNHIPVCHVSVHGYLHSSAAGSYLAVKGVVLKRSYKSLKVIHIGKSRCCGNISSV